MNRLYYEEIDLEPSYTDEHLYSEADILDSRAAEDVDELLEGESDSDA